MEDDSLRSILRKKQFKLGRLPLYRKKNILDNYKYVNYFVFYSRKIISRVKYRNF